MKRCGPFNTNRSLSWVLSALTVFLIAELCFAQQTPKRPTRTPRRRGPVQIIQLPQPKTSSSGSFEQLLAQLNATRFPATTPLSAEQIGQLAWAAQGVRLSNQSMNMANVAPGDKTVGDPMLDLRVYFATYSGLYRYEPRGHFLEQINATDVRMALSSSAMGQITTPPGCAVILASSGQNRAGRIKQNEQKIMDIKVGQIAQSIRLQAASLRLYSVPATILDLNVIRRTCSFPKLIIPYHIMFVGYAPGQTPVPANPNSDQVTPADNRPMRAAMILPAQGFRDEELIDAVRVLNASSVLTVIAGPDVGTARGMLGTAVQVEIPLQQLDVDKFDAIVFVGGTGSLEYVNNPLATSIAGEAVRKGKIVGASSMAPMILASAGLLKGVSVTGFNGNRQSLVSTGATYTGAPVERDRLIITSSGPAATVAFAKAIAEALYSQ